MVDSGVDGGLGGRGNLERNEEGNRLRGEAIRNGWEGGGERIDGWEVGRNRGGDGGRDAIGKSVLHLSCSLGLLAVTQVI